MFIEKLEILSLIKYILYPYHWQDDTCTQSATYIKQIIKKFNNKHTIKSNSMTDKKH